MIYYNIISKSYFNKLKNKNKYLLDKQVVCIKEGSKNCHKGNIFTVNGIGARGFLFFKEKMGCHNYRNFKIINMDKLRILDKVICVAKNDKLDIGESGTILAINYNENELYLHNISGSFPINYFAKANTTIFKRGDIVYPIIDTNECEKNHYYTVHDYNSLNELYLKEVNGEYNPEVFYLGKKREDNKKEHITKPEKSINIPQKREKEMNKVIAEVFEKTADAVLVEKHLGQFVNENNPLDCIILRTNKEAVLAKAKEMEAEEKEKKTTKKD